MAVNSQEIIAAIERVYPQTDNAVTIKNCSDLDIEGQLTRGHQYIIGLAHRDPMQNACERYQHTMRERLEGFGLHCEFSVWSWEDYDLEATIATLKELSEHLEANMDIDRMVRKLNIGKPKGENYFVVVTIVFIPIISVSAEEDEEN